MFPDGSDLIRHAGYFAWRGFIPFKEMDELKFKVDAHIPREPISFILSERSHAVFYYLNEGLNWLVYLNNDDGSESYIARNEVAGNISKVFIS